MQIKDYINFENNITFIKVKVTPKANKSDSFSMLDDRTLKIRIKAVPEKGKANKELINYLAKELNLKKNNFEITSGDTDQVKKIKITK